MNEIVAYTTNLPDTMEDLAQFVLIGREKLTAVKAAIRAIEKLHIAEEVRKQKRQEAQMISEAVLDAEVRLGQLFKQVPTRQGGDRRSEDFKHRSESEFEKNANKTKTEVVHDLGFSEDQAQRLETLADNADIVEYVKAEARENDEFPTRARVLELAAYQKKQGNEFDEYDDFLDLRTKTYKEYTKIIEAIERFEITDRRMDALRDNFDENLTVDEHIEDINRAVDKLNLIKMKILRGKAYEKK